MASLSVSHSSHGKRALSPQKDSSEVAIMFKVMTTYHNFYAMLSTLCLILYSLTVDEEPIFAGIIQLSLILLCHILLCSYFPSLAVHLKTTCAWSQF